MDNNYTLLEKRVLKDIGSEGYLYRHKSGAQILYIKNDDENKVFSASFKTPPADDRGLPHIMEHCVLAGSQKYPAKEPFNELVKGSLYTYLNAMTFTDKTMYPIASCNDKDFLNLMDVYLDAVFFPKIYDRKESFLQEGWHYEMEDESAPLAYNGIVYNEMKGAYSDPYDLLDMAVNRALLPDTPYRYDSGGNPDCITELSYENFLEFHQKYYHPENSYLYFYGNMDIAACFEKLDKEYLSRFEPVGLHIDIEKQESFDAPVFAEGKYSIASGEGEEKNYLAAGYIVGDWADSELSVSFNLLRYILLSTPASPLYKALIEAEIGEDISGDYSDEAMHPVLHITVKNSPYSAEKLKEAADKALQDIVDNGLDKKLVNACINFIEFHYREEDYGYRPRGLVYNMRALSGWLYGGNPFDRLDVLSRLETIRGRCEGNYFEGLIDKYLLRNSHRAYVTLVPALGLDDEHEKRTEAKLAEIKGKLSAEEIQNVIAVSESLRLYQETPDTAENLKAVPLLELADIKKEITTLLLAHKEENGATVLHSSLETNDIIYTNIFFDTSGVPSDKLPVIKILLYLLAKVDTNHYAYADMTSRIKESLGGLSFRFDISIKDKNTFRSFAIVSAKMLSKNTEEMFDIVAEIINESVFDDKARIKNYISELKAGMDDSFITAGSSVAIKRSLSYFSAGNGYADAVSGIGFYDYACALLKNYDAAFDALQRDLQEMAALLFNDAQVFYTVTCNDGLYDKFAAELSAFHDVLSKGEQPEGTACPAAPNKNEAFITASKVQYNVAAANYRDFGFAYSGAMRVLANILSNVYLVEQIRIKGGAYGCGADFSRSGSMYYYSYRDPNLQETFAVYKRAADYIGKFEADEREMTKLILGAVNTIDRPLRNSHKGLAAVTNDLLGITDEMRQAERNEILGATPEMMRDFAKILEKCCEQNYICVFGGNTAISKSGSMFEHIRKI